MRPSQAETKNENWALLTFLAYILNSEETEAEELKIEYFEPGYSFMSADGLRHQVERSMKAKSKIYDTLSTPHYFKSSSHKLRRKMPYAHSTDKVTVRVLRIKRTLPHTLSFNCPEIELNFLAALQ
jgi:hypothetical protein